MIRKVDEHLKAPKAATAKAGCACTCTATSTDKEKAPIEATRTSSYLGVQYDLGGGAC